MRQAASRLQLRRTTGKGPSGSSADATCRAGKKAGGGGALNCTK